MIRSLYTWVLISVLFLSANKNSYAQACCSGGTPLSSNLGIQSISAKSINLQLAYDYNTQQDLVARSTKLDDNRRIRDTHSALLRATYAVNNKLSFSTLFSFVTQEETIQSSFGDNFKSSTGVGDMAALLQYQVLSKNDFEWTVAAGIKLPIGATDRIDKDLGILLNPDLQPGTGAIDYLMGFNVSFNHLFKPNLTFLYLSTFRLTAPADRFGGQLRYEFGNEWQNLFGFRDSYVLKAFILNPSLLMRYRITGMDESNGQLVANTSGQWLHLVPGIDFLLSPNWSIGMSSEIPIYRNLDGTQLTTSYRFKLTLDYTLNFQPR